MSQSIRLQLNEKPSTLSLYTRALFAKGLKGTPKLPTTSITLANIKAGAKEVEQYRSVCGFNHDNNQLPVTYPHLLAFPLHLELMLLKDFPFPLMGMIHIKNDISQHRAINLFETMDVTCSFDSIRKTQKGYEVDIKTAIHITGEVVWESISTNLVRKKKDALKVEITKSNPEKNKIPKELPYKEFWSLPSDLGRRYALVSGDSNPIHLFPLSAKLFGFKGHIAHGMWTKARVIAALFPKLNSESCRVVVHFKMPIFLPSNIQLNFQINEQINEQIKHHVDKKLVMEANIQFEVKDETGTKPHMQGYIYAL
jgi:acyl dehydratase